MIENGAETLIVIIIPQSHSSETVAVRTSPSVLDSELNTVLDDVLGIGDQDSFRKILRAYGLSLRSYIATQVQHMDDIDDLAQDVFLVAFRNLRHFRRGDDFGAWLRGIARNKMHDHFRSSARRHRALERFREEVVRVVEANLERAVSADNSGAIEMLLQCIARRQDLRHGYRERLESLIGWPAACYPSAGVAGGTVRYRIIADPGSFVRFCNQDEAGRLLGV